VSAYLSWLLCASCRQLSHTTPPYSFPQSLRAHSYTWEDQKNLDQAQWTYTFNICGNVNTLPDYCYKTLPNPVSASGPFTGVQWSGNVFNATTKRECHPVGNSITTNAGRLPYSMGLVNPNDPSAGVYLTYNPVQDPNPTGNPCDATRQLTLNFW
jgi:hypothetical protein